MASVDDFHKIEMRIGRILTAEFIEGADKLLKLTVDFGPKKKDTPTEPAAEGVESPSAPEEREIRQILSGIREFYSPEELIGKQCPFVTNLAPRTMRGLVSDGMILAVKTETGGAVLLHPDKEVLEGNMLS